MYRNHPWFHDNPIGDPFGGPAAGKYEDSSTIGLLGSGLGAYLGYQGAQGAAGQLIGASNAANATLGALTGQAIGSLNQSTGLGAQLTNAPRQTGNYATQALAQALGLPQQQLDQTQLPGGGTLQGTTLLPQQGAGSPLGSLLKPFSYTAQDFQSSPGYQFALEQGLNTIQNNAAAKGMLLSPNTIKDLSTYATGVANQDFQQQYQNAYQAYTQNQANQLNTLGSLMGAGNTATGNLVNNITQAGSNTANLLSSLGVAQAQNQLGAGSAAAAGRVGATNALTGGLGNISNLLSAGRYLNTGSNILSGNGLAGIGDIISGVSPGLAGSLGDALGMSIGGTYGPATQAGLDALISGFSEGSGALAAGAGAAEAGAAGAAAGGSAAGGAGATAGGEAAGLGGAGAAGLVALPFAIAIAGMLNGIFGAADGPPKSQRDLANEYAMLAGSYSSQANPSDPNSTNPLYQQLGTFNNWLTPDLQNYWNQQQGLAQNQQMTQDLKNRYYQYDTGPLAAYMRATYGDPTQNVSAGLGGYTPDQYSAAANYFQGQNLNLSNYNPYTQQYEAGYNSGWGGGG